MKSRRCFRITLSNDSRSDGTAYYYKDDKEFEYAMSKVIVTTEKTEYAFSQMGIEQLKHGLEKEI